MLGYFLSPIRIKYKQLGWGTGHSGERQNAIQKGFRFWCFLVQWEIVLNRILAFDPPVENVIWLGFLVEDFYSARKGPHLVALRD